MDERFRLDSLGQLVPEDESARQALNAYQGTFRLLPTPTDLLFLVRQPISGAKLGSPRVVLAGDAAAFPISDLIAFLSQARWSGSVRIHAPAGERSISLKEGEVRGASSDDPADRLGEVMVRLGLIDRATLESPDVTPPRIGRVLVEKGLIQPHDLWKAITQQVSDIFHAIVLCREGAFVLLDQEMDDKSVQNIQLSTQSLLMDSIRKIDELAHFRKRIPHGRVYVARKRLSDGKLEADEDRVLALATGDRTVFELGQAAKLSEFDVTKILFRLLEGGYAAVAEHPISAVESPQAAPPKPPAGARAPTPAPVERPLPKARDPRTVIRVFNFIFREIRDEVAKQRMENEFIAAANAALMGKSLSSSPVLEGLNFDAAGSLPDTKVLESYERNKARLGSEPTASLKQALSDVMFFLLFHAGELLEARADEDLARRVKELLSTIEGD